MTTRIAALLAVALLVLGVGCDRQARVAVRDQGPGATTVVSTPAVPVSTPAPAPAGASIGPDLHTVDSVLTDIDTQLATVDRDLATDEGDPTK